MTKPIFLLYDERMSHHRPLTNHFIIVETPERIMCLKKRLDELNLYLIQRKKKTKELTLMNQQTCNPIDQKPQQQIILLEKSLENDFFVPLRCLEAPKEVILLVHSEEYYESLKRSADATDEKLIQMALCDKDGDMYYNNNTFQAATLACGGVICCVNSVLVSVSSSVEVSSRAIAVVRPPGHHACQQHAMGFCFFNSVVVAAKHAIHNKGVRRVVILDWDIHHGNGTQDLTYDDPNILYISLHRKGQNSKSFFPGTGSHEEVGSGDAEGTNLNITWTKGGVGNTEYAAAFSELILPLVVEFEPNLVLVSCGFDAAKGDLLGDCEVTPEMYYCMTKSILLGLGAEIPIVIALEGGYNNDVNCDCMEAVSLALLDEPWGGNTSNKQNFYQSIYQVSPQDCPSRMIKEGFKSKGERLNTSRRILSQFWDFDAINDKERGCGAQTFAIKSINQSMAVIQRTSFWRNREIHLSQIKCQKKRMTKKKPVADDAALDSVGAALGRLVLEK